MHNKASIDADVQIDCISAALTPTLSAVTMRSGIRIPGGRRE